MNSKKTILTVCLSLAMLITPDIIKEDVRFFKKHILFFSYPKRRRASFR